MASPDYTAPYWLLVEVGTGGALPDTIPPGDVFRFQPNEQEGFFSQIVLFGDQTHAERTAAHLDSQPHRQSSQMELKVASLGAVGCDVVTFMEQLRDRPVHHVTFTVPGHPDVTVPIDLVIVGFNTAR